ncbi:transferase family protein [Trichosporon asahii var. asahii CBS 8904]|uniref:Transferase family protein n=1 Tax=Trichosporon asahii var. asahii (strain CBS 8904) TaxID=1220162 RepID=K1VH07_TRIAC|nr:transferase family protein [Trichosporon asahii var. asahii CBS 8904]
MVSFQTGVDADEQTADNESTVHLRIRIQPAAKAPLTIEPIQIMGISSVVAPNTTALLFYNERLDDGALFDSLQHFLTVYPFLGGKFIFASELGDDKPADAAAYTLRHLRTWIKWGTETDPGMPFTVVQRKDSMAAHQPRFVQNGVTDLTPFHGNALTPPTKGLLADRDTPCGMIQVTHFTDGTSVALSVSHMLADATTAAQMLKDWAAIHRSLAAGKLEIPSRPFHYADVDGQAAGDLNSEFEDPVQTEIESKQDMFRYDGWASGMPIPDHLKAADERQGSPRGKPLPPNSLVFAQDVAYHAVHFSAADLERIHARVQGQAEGFVSIHDAFAAHLWRLMTRARQQTGTLDLNVACDARRRFPRPLPSNTLGMFNTCLGFQGEADVLLGEKGEAWAAQRLRQAIGSFTPETIAAFLHRRAHDLHPMREQICACHPENTIMTTWARAGLEDVDFGTGKPVYTHFHVQAFPGYVCIMRECGEGEKWYEPGLHADLWLETEAMERFLADPELRR